MREMWKASLAVCALVVTLGDRAEASTTCDPSGLCVAQVEFAQFAEEAYMSQLQSQWCWAASISMLYAYYGHPVAQARIVSDVYGGPENIPAGTGYTIAGELNRCWVDDAGGEFASELTGVYDADWGVNALTNQEIVAELAAGHPLIIGARTHAMVLTAVQYQETPYGPNIIGAGVFDPWPGVGARALYPDELVAVENGGSLRFLATARVFDVSDGACPVQPIDPGPGFGPPGTCASVAGRSSSGVGGGVAALAAALLVVARRRRR